MRVLLVEDDDRIAREVSLALGAAGFAVDREGCGEAACRKGLATDYAAVILDLGLPQLDGLAVLKRWRGAGRNMPVLVLSARGDWIERVEGIDAGADDYLPKPFRMEEVLARLRAILRRTKEPDDGMITAGRLTLDQRQMLISQDGTPLALTRQEYRLLSSLIANAGVAVPLGELLEALYADSREKDANVVEVVVGRVRRKLAPGTIQTRRGIGYIVAGSDG